MALELRSPSSTAKMNHSHQRNMISKKWWVAGCSLFIYLFFLTWTFRVFYTGEHVRIGSTPLSNFIVNATGRSPSSPRRASSSSSSSSWSTLSLSILMSAVQNVPRPIPDELVDLSTEPQRCVSTDPNQRRNLWDYRNRTVRRRIFAGGLLADDSWHALGASALENYGVYHAVVFVESNRTQSNEPRKVRFGPGSEDLRILQSGIFGPNTIVHVEQFVHEQKERPMVREHMMRQVVLEKWKELGMTRDDLGLIFDVDEIPARDFLRTTQICELGPKTWDSSSAQTCKTPMLRMSIPMFEGSPMCIHQGNTKMGMQFNRFTYPTMVIGACIEGIGDEEHHGLAPRIQKDSNGHSQGARQEGYGGGKQNPFKSIPKGNQYGKYPLYNAADFRAIMGVGQWGGVGYHLHNFFVSTDALRFKHAYYGHPHKHAYVVPLGAMNADLNVLVKCVHNISDHGNRKQRLLNGLELLAQQFDLPAAFQLPGYVEARHAEVLALVLQDEEEYGRADKFDAHHLYNEETMLTHPGRRHQQNGNGTVTTKN